MAEVEVLCISVQFCVICRNNSVNTNACTRYVYICMHYAEVCEACDERAQNEIRRSLTHYLRLFSLRLEINTEDCYKIDIKISP